MLHSEVSRKLRTQGKISGESDYHFTLARLNDTRFNLITDLNHVSS